MPDLGNLPSLATPVMLAAPGHLPTSDGWAYEVKWDGVRALVATGEPAPQRVRARSRSGRDSTVAYPELQHLADTFDGRQVLLDGEVVALDAAGRPSFERLQPRMLVADPGVAAQLAGTVPATFLAFDVLALDGSSLLAEPYHERRELLTSLAAETGLTVPPSFPSDGAAVLTAARTQGLEGVVAKRCDSRYEPGQRSGAWTKVRVISRQDCVVGGWRPGESGRVGSIGALLIGVQEPGGLRFVGRVGSGLSDAALRDLAARMAPLRQATSPFAGPVPRPDAKGAVWVEPRLVCAVDYATWTSSGRLRHPSYRGLREDVDPADVVRDPAGVTP